jgi:hypothetical protein
MLKQEPSYGPDNPHPLSTRKTELIWEGKYDEYGNRREVDIAGCALPMQKIETIDKPTRSLVFHLKSMSYAPSSQAQIFFKMYQ